MLRHPALVVLFTLVLVSTTVEAQQRGGRGRGGLVRRGTSDGLSFLLRSGEVRQELGVSEEQDDLLIALIYDLRNQRFALFLDHGGPSADPAATEEFGKSLSAISRQSDELVSLVLEPKQAARLREIRLQYEGVSALDRDEIVKSLGISGEQRKKIRTIREGDRGPGQVTSQQETEILALLTDEQRQAWTKMKGKEFRFRSGPSQSPFRGGRRNRGERP